MKTESCINLWVQKQVFRGQFEIVPIQQNNSSRFTPGAYELPTIDSWQKLFYIPTMTSPKKNKKEKKSTSTASTNKVKYQDLN